MQAGARWKSSGGRAPGVVERPLHGGDESAYEAACTFFTQDTRVFMVFTPLAHNPLLSACLTKAGIGFTSDYLPPSDSAMRGLPVYAPDDLSEDRHIALLGRALVDGGFFTKDAKVAIQRFDDPGAKRLADTVLKPILKGARVEVAYEASYDPFRADQRLNDAQGEVLRMRGAGVTHVITWDTPLYFMLAAESQNWTPHWSLTSRAGAGSFLEKAAPRRQLANAAGPGWQPVLDLASAPPVSKESTRCLAIMRARGYPASGPALSVQQALCGLVFHFASVMKAVSTPTADSFRIAAERLTGHVSPLTFGVEYGGRHDGASLYRMIGWDGGCGCFAYVSPIKPIR